MSEQLYLYVMTQDAWDPQVKPLRRLRPLRDDEINDLIREGQILAEFEAWDGLMHIVTANYDAYSQAVAECSASALGAYRRGRFRALVDLTVNRGIVNVVTAFRLLLDHTETRLKHRYGEPSKQVAAFETATSEAFDRSFAYRFIYSLRNYAVHCGLPVVNMVLVSRAGGVGKQDNHDVSYHIDPSHLLRTGPSYWRGQIKNDLQDRKDPIEVDAILKEAIEELAGVDRRVIEIEKPRLHQAGRAIMNVLDDAFRSGGVPVVGSFATAGDAGKLRMKDLPYVMLERLGYLELPA